MGSSFNNRLDFDMFHKLQSDRNKYSQLGNPILLGDFNAHTSDNANYIEQDHNNHIPLPNDNISDESIITRHNQDKIVNEFGRELIYVLLLNCLQSMAKPLATLMVS